MGAIHFDFTVTDEEAQALFECITDRAVSLKFSAGSDAFDEHQKKQLLGHAKFLTDLRAKMTNRRK